MVTNTRTPENAAQCSIELSWYNTVLYNKYLCSAFTTAADAQTDSALYYVSLYLLAGSHAGGVAFCQQVFFVESVCDDPEVIAANIMVGVWKIFFISILYSLDIT